MKGICEKWWKNHTKVFQITNYKEDWKKVGNKPRFCIFTNGGKRSKGDKCYDWTMILGYTIFNYTNFDLQKTIQKKHKN